MRDLTDLELATVAGGVAVGVKCCRNPDGTNCYDITINVEPSKDETERLGSLEALRRLIAKIPNPCPGGATPIFEL